MQQQQRHASTCPQRQQLHQHAIVRAQQSRRRAWATRATQQQAAPATQVQLEKLIAWAKSKGTSVDKVAAAPDLQLDGGSVLVAAKDLGTGEAVLSVADNLWLNASTAVRSSPIGAAVQQLEPWVQIALYLVHTSAQPGAGDWAPYVASLPQHPSTPLFWTAEQQALLQGSQCAEVAAGYR